MLWWGMEISIDVDRMTRDIRANQQAFEAMRGSTDRVGYGAVMTGHRRGTQEQRERRRQDIRDIRAAGVRRAAPFAYRIMTGWGIANFLKSQGKDPFEYPQDEVDFVAKSMEEEISDALDDAYRTGRPQVARIRRVLDAAAAHLRDVAKQQIEAGGLGKNAPIYRLRKLRQAQRGEIPSDFGVPPPYGVRTGEFVKGIRKAFFARKKPPVMR